MQFTRRKTIARKFPAIVLDENDLARLATRVQQSCTDSRLEIVVTSGDGQDAFTTSDPAFFLSEMAPQVLSEVSIRAWAKGNLTFTIQLQSSANGRAEISAAGEDVNAVAGLFHELVRELEHRQSRGAAWVRKVESAPGMFFLSVVAALAVYSVFDLPLNIAARYVPGFAGSTLYMVVSVVGWFCVASALGGGGFFLQERLLRLVPPVRFVGRLSDPATPTRLSIAWALAAVIGPILLNVLANLISYLAILRRAG